MINTDRKSGFAFQVTSTLKRGLSVRVLSEMVYGEATLTEGFRSPITYHSRLVPDGVFIHRSTVAFGH